MHTVSFRYVLALTTALALAAGCQKKTEETPAPTAGNPTEELRSMGAHDPRGCPDLQGIYVPATGPGSYFLFEKVDGSLVMKSRRPDGPEFQGAIRVDGSTKYNGAEAATARCSGGKILIDVSHPTKPKKTALFKGGPQGMTRVVFQEGTEPTSTDYTRMYAGSSN